MILRVLTKSVVSTTVIGVMSLLNGCTDKSSTPEPIVAAAPAKDQADAKKIKKKKKKKSTGLEDRSWQDNSGGSWFLSKSRLNWKDAQNQCDALAKATKRRWRLPSPEELLRASEAGISSSKNEEFGYIHLGRTWTQNWETSFDSRVAVYVDMGHKKPFRTDMDKKMTVVCVRTDKLGQGNAWVDAKTNQVWRYVPGKRDWENAKAACMQLSAKEKLPWRLATSNELTTAVEGGLQDPVNEAFGREYLTQAWTQEVDSSYPSEAYAVDLRNASHFLFQKGQFLSTVCIRPLAH